LDQLPELIDDVQAQRPQPKNKSKRQANYLKKIPLHWDDELEEAWQFSRTWLTTEPILCTFLPGYPVVISCDSSLIAQNGIIEQYRPNGMRQPLAYYSRRVSGLKQHWPATLLETDGMCWVLKKAKQFIETDQFAVITDHRAIQFITNYNGSNTKLVEKALFLAEFGDRIHIVHKPGYLFLKADPFSRLLSYVMSYVLWSIDSPEILEKIRKATLDEKHPYYKELIERLQRERLPIDSQSQWWYVDGILHFRYNKYRTWRMYIPGSLRAEITSEVHCSSGHLGFDKIIARMTDNFWWPKFYFFFFFFFL
jgi:hypothetical protein